VRQNKLGAILDTAKKKQPKKRNRLFSGEHDLDFMEATEHILHMESFDDDDTLIKSINHQGMDHKSEED